MIGAVKVTFAKPKLARDVCAHPPRRTALPDSDQRTPSRGAREHHALLGIRPPGRARTRSSSRTATAATTTVSSRSSPGCPRSGSSAPTCPGFGSSTPMTEAPHTHRGLRALARRPSSMRSGCRRRRSCSVTPSDRWSRPARSPTACRRARSSWSTRSPPTRKVGAGVGDDPSDPRVLRRLPRAADAASPTRCCATGWSCSS